MDFNPDPDLPGEIQDFKLPPYMAPEPAVVKLTYSFQLYIKNAPEWRKCQKFAEVSIRSGNRGDAAVVAIHMAEGIAKQFGTGIEIRASWMENTRVTP